jgi:Cu(I)/Ag(I) efflux system membrane protein CusA/SilA
MLGGMLTVTVLNLLVLPVIYSLVLQHQESAKKTVAGVQEASV